MGRWWILVLALGCAALVGPAGAEATIANTLHNLTRSEEHTSELQSHSEISYAVFCLKKKKK